MPDAGMGELVMRNGLLAAFAAVAVVLVGAGPSHAANTQQDKMSACNAQAASKNLSGDSRKSFMSSCLSGNAGKSASTAKSSSCTAQADAKKLSGAARTSFVNKCAAG